MSVDLNTSLARTLVDEWARAGVTVAALSPGSRSTPLALALAGDARIAVHVFLDETRAYYDLDRLWGDVPRLDAPNAGVVAPVSQAAT